MPHAASVRPPSVRTGMSCSASNASSSSSLVGTGSGRFHITTATTSTTTENPISASRWIISPMNSRTVPHAATNGQIDGPETRMTSSGSAWLVLVTSAARHVSGQRARRLQQPDRALVAGRQIVLVPQRVPAVHDRRHRVPLVRRRRGDRPLQRVGAPRVVPRRLAAEVACRRG